MCPLKRKIHFTQKGHTGFTSTLTVPKAAGIGLLSFLPLSFGRSLPTPNHPFRTHRTANPAYSRQHKGAVAFLAYVSEIESRDCHGGYVSEKCFEWKSFPAENDIILYWTRKAEEWSTRVYSSRDKGYPVGVPPGTRMIHPFAMGGYYMNRKILMSNFIRRRAAQSLPSWVSGTANGKRVYRKVIRL